MGGGRELVGREERGRMDDMTHCCHCEGLRQSFFWPKKNPPKEEKTRAISFLSAVGREGEEGEGGQNLVVAARHKLRQPFSSPFLPFHGKRSHMTDKALPISPQSTFFLLKKFFFFGSARCVCVLSDVKCPLMVERTSFPLLRQRK